MEALRMTLGPWARVLHGGIVEELLFRRSVLALLAWIGAQLFGEATPAVMWAMPHRLLTRAANPCIVEAVAFRRSVLPYLHTAQKEG
jgi:hypothetical protein